MGLFKKNEDPISERARHLSAEIAALEARINSLNDPAIPEARPKMRSTALPHGPTVTAGSVAPAPQEARKQPQPVFETLDHNRLKSHIESTDRHYNDMGMRKYDLVGFFGRIKHLFQGSSHSNPKLVNLLAAGSVQGLRSLRYEKRIARHRFFAVIIFVILILLTMLAMHHS